MTVRGPLTHHSPMHSPLSRRHLLGGGALGAAALLAGCSGTLPPVDTSADGFGENATGTVRVWCRAATQEPTLAAIKAFNASHDDLHVEVTPLPEGGQFVTKLATSIRGGTVPDLVDFDLINCPMFIVRDAFADLTEQVKELGIGDVVSPGHLNLLTYQDKYYGVPYMGDYSTLWYNTDILEKAGVDPDSATKDLPSLLEACRTIKDEVDGVEPFTFPGNASGSLGFTDLPMIWAAGSDLLSQDDVSHQKAQVEGNDALAAMLEFHQKLWDEELVAQRAYSDEGTQWGADFRTGKVAFFPGSYGATIPEADDEVIAKMGNVLTPGPDGGRSTYSGGDNLCIPNGAKNPSGAWELCKYLLEVKQQERMPEQGYLPVRSDAATARFRKDFPLAVPPIEDLDKGYVPFTLGYNLLFSQQSGPWLAMFREAVFEGDIDGAMATAQGEFDRVLDQTRA